MNRVLAGLLVKMVFSVQLLIRRVIDYGRFECVEPRDYPKRDISLSVCRVVCLAFLNKG